MFKLVAPWVYYVGLLVIPVIGGIVGAIYAGVEDEEAAGWGFIVVGCVLLLVFSWPVSAYWCPLDANTIVVGPAGDIRATVWDAVKIRKSDVRLSEATLISFSKQAYPHDLGEGVGLILTWGGEPESYLRVRASALQENLEIQDWIKALVAARTTDLKPPKDVWKREVRDEFRQRVRRLFTDLADVRVNVVFPVKPVVPEGQQAEVVEK